MFVALAVVEMVVLQVNVYIAIFGSRDIADRTSKFKKIDVIGKLRYKSIKPRAITLTFCRGIL